MIYADTSYLLALAEPKDALHLRASAWSDCLTEPFILTEYVFWEAINFLSRIADRSKGHGLIRFIRSSTNYVVVPASSELFEAGLQLHFKRTDKEWSLTDCISFLVMQERGITQALTYDHHFEQAGFEALLRRDPP